MPVGPREPIGPNMLNESKILVIGATSGTGLETARLLLEEGAALNVFVRNLAKARHLFDESVRIFGGDLMDPERLPEAFEGVDQLVFTAGVTKRPCPEQLIIETEYEGMKRTLEAAERSGFGGRIAFLSSIGVTNPNWASRLLNKVKGNALKWRLAMEDLIRGSGFDYSIVRAGYLMNSVSRKRIAFTQANYALEMRHRIGRKEAAHVIVEALRTNAASRKTFGAVRDASRAEQDWESDFARLKTDEMTTGENR